MLCTAGAQTGGGGMKQAVSGERHGSAVHPLIH